MSVTQEIADRLEDAFSPTELNVIDDSESHFNVKIRSAHFKGLNRLARHRAVHDALGPDLIGRIHALSLDLST